jgi:hypothetical protein
LSKWAKWTIGMKYEFCIKIKYHFTWNYIWKTTSKQRCKLVFFYIIVAMIVTLTWLMRPEKQMAIFYV